MKGQPSWHLLAQLSSLEDLALQCREDLSCCVMVLAASQRTLQQVTLASKAWDTPTYRSLQHLKRLRNLTLKVDSMSLENAEALAKLRQSGEMSLMLRKCMDLEHGVIQELSRDGFCMTCLLLREASRSQVEELQTMAALQTLVIACPELDVNVCDLQPQPNLQQLFVIGCHGVTDNGMRWIPVAFPVALPYWHSCEHRVLRLLRTSTSLPSVGLIVSLCKVARSPHSGSQWVNRSSREKLEAGYQDATAGWSITATG